MNFRIKILVVILISSFAQAIMCQNIEFKYKSTPKESGFKMDGYWIWGGSIIKVGSTYHLFASRWKKDGAFPEGYRQNSEIVRATSSTPLGPYKFEEVVIGERDSSYWDSNMAHNPTIHKIGNEYVLFYIGSDFTTKGKDPRYLLRRVGYASSKSITGPWKRSEKPVVDEESNNPAVLTDGNKIKLLYRDSELRMFMAESDNYKGPYTTINEDVWPQCRLEDFYLFKTKDQYHIICEDNVGGISGHERWGVHLFSADGKSNWKIYEPTVVYDHEIKFDDGTSLHCVRRERPQLLIRNRKITHLATGVYDGKDSWCQPVELVHPVRIINRK